MNNDRFSIVKRDIKIIKFNLKLFLKYCNISLDFKARETVRPQERK
jgi:hypothetical protein